MCNYQNKTKNLCAKIVGGISVLLGIMGLVLVIFAMGARNYSALPKEMTDQMDKQTSKSNKEAAAGFSGILTVVGIIIIIIALLGCGTAKMKKPYLAIPFGCMIIILSVILIPIGLLSIGGSTIVRKAATITAQAGCQKDPYQPMVDLMCSRDCLCDDDLKGDWGLFNVEDKLNDYGRTSLKSKAGMKPLLFMQPGKGGAKTMLECITKNSDKQKQSAAAKQAQKESLAVMSAMEKKFDCAGFCGTPLFYITKDYSKQPITNCVSSLVNVIAGPLSTVGIVALLTGVIGVIAFCGSFPLCKAFNEKEDEN